MRIQVSPQQMDAAQIQIRAISKKLDERLDWKGADREAYNRHQRRSGTSRSRNSTGC